MNTRQHTLIKLYRSLTELIKNKIVSIISWTIDLKRVSDNYFPPLKFQGKLIEKD